MRIVHTVAGERGHLKKKNKGFEPICNAKAIEIIR